MSMKPLLGLLMLMLACDMPSGMDRSNPLDPKSSEFNVKPLGAVQIQVDPSGTVDILLPASATQIDGYVIEKMLSPGTPYTQIGTASRASTRFTDTSKDVRKGTTYRVSTYLSDGSGKIIVSSNTGTAVFGRLASSSHVVSEDARSLEYRLVMDSPFVNEIRIESNRSLSASGGTRLTAQSRGGNTFTFTDAFVDLDFTDRTYTAYAYQTIGTQSVLIDSSTVVFRPRTAFPMGQLTIQPQSESLWKLTWQNDVWFATGFKVYRRLDHEPNQPFVWIADVPVGQLEYLDQDILRISENANLVTPQARTYRVVAVASGIESMPAVNQQSISVAVPQLTSLAHAGANAVTLNWSISNTTWISHFVIEYAQHNPNQNPVWTPVVLASSERSHTVNGLSTSGTYLFRMRTRTSSPSEYRAVAYRRDVVHHVSMPAAGNQSISALRTTPDRTKAVASSIFSNQITVLDVQNKQVLRQIQAAGNVRGLDLNSTATKLYYSDGARVTEVDFPSGLNPRTVFTSPITNTMGIITLLITPNDRYIVGTGGTGDVFVYDMVTSTYRTIDTHTGNPTVYLQRKVALSTDGSFLYYSTQALKRYNMNTGALATISGFESWRIMIDAVFSEDGNTLLIVNNSNTLYSHKTGSSVVNMTNRNTIHSSGARPGHGSQFFVAHNTGIDLIDTRLTQPELVSTLIQYSVPIHTMVPLSENLLLFGTDAGVVELIELLNTSTWMEVSTLYI